MRKKLFNSRHGNVYVVVDDEDYPLLCSLREPFLRRKSASNPQYRVIDRTTGKLVAHLILPNAGRNSIVYRNGNGLDLRKENMVIRKPTKRVTLKMLMQQGQGQE